ncbi:hypothetical protein L2E82_38029 [Cichorium intybus]|uniref:Uncharacterized protein n=1 Tax=Cichorium intybus TaxID=13427 RepID=A0ACB9AEQ9_CICIN|nr:hypothetical protein L2E82_38029 [Cichorium intybus]
MLNFDLVTKIQAFTCLNTTRHNNYFKEMPKQSPLKALKSVNAALASSEIEHKVETKKKAIPHKAAGQAWEDPTLAEWPKTSVSYPSCEVMKCDIGNEVNDDVLLKAFSRFPSYNMARVVEQFGIPHLFDLPIRPILSASGDSAIPEVVADSQGEVASEDSTTKSPLRTLYLQKAQGLMAVQRGLDSSKPGELEDDVASLQNETLIAIKAPHGTTLEVPEPDEIIFTHEHTDAVLGVDDIRAVQPFSPINHI